MTDQTKNVETMSVPEAGRLLGVGRDAAYAAAHRGEIPVVRIGHLLRVPRKAMERLLNGDGPKVSDRAA